jgi:uncharacterized membrane protein
MNIAYSLARSRWLLALFFCGAGVLHFVFPTAYVHIIPPGLPAPLALVWISGVCEILGGTGLTLSCLRRPAGYGLIALLIAVFPANIYMLVQQWTTRGWSPYALLLLLRLPIQFLLMAWVHRSTHTRGTEVAPNGER